MAYVSAMDPPPLYAGGGRQQAPPERSSTPAFGAPTARGRPADAAAADRTLPSWRDGSGPPTRPAVVLGPSAQQLRDASSGYAPVVLPSTILPWPPPVHAVAAPTPVRPALVRRPRSVPAATPPPTGPLPPVPDAAAPRSWVEEATDSPPNAASSAPTRATPPAAQNATDDAFSSSEPSPVSDSGQYGAFLHGPNPLDEVAYAVGRGQVPAAGKIRALQRYLRDCYRTAESSCPTTLLNHVDQLDRLQHGLATIACAFPPLWPYPVHHPRPPAYRPGGSARHPLVRLDAQDALRQLASTTSASVWEAALAHARALQHQNPNALARAYARLEGHFAALLDAQPEHAPDPGALRRAKKAAQLAFSLAVARGAYRAAGHALDHYARLAGAELDADADANRAAKYEGHPLPARELHAYLQTCSTAQLAGAPLWHPGLRTVVNEGLLLGVLARLHPARGVAAPMAERWARTAAGYGRLPDGAWMRALAIALEQAPYLDASRAQRRVGAIAERALLARRQAGGAPYPHLPLTLTELSDLLPGQWRREAIRRALHAPHVLTDAEVLQLLAEADAEAADVPRPTELVDKLVPLHAAAPGRYEAPLLGVPLLYVLLALDALRACAEVFEGLRVGSTAAPDDGPGDEARVLDAAVALLRVSVQRGAADVTGRVLARLQRCGLRWRAALPSDPAPAAAPMDRSLST